MLDIKLSEPNASYPTFDLKMQVERDINVLYINIDGRAESKGRTMNILNQTLDYCKAITGKKWDLFSLGFLLIFRDVKTIPRKCPIQKVGEQLLNKNVDINNYLDVCYRETILWITSIWMKALMHTVFLLEHFTSEQLCIQ